MIVFQCLFPEIHIKNWFLKKHEEGHHGSGFFFTTKPHEGSIINTVLYFVCIIRKQNVLKVIRYTL